MKSLLTFFAAAFFSFSSAAFDFASWKPENLAKAEYKNKVLHLVSNGKNRKPAALRRRFSANEIKDLAGKMLVISADAEICSTDGKGTVAFVISGRRENGKRFSRRCAAPLDSKTKDFQLSVSLDVPGDARILNAYIEAARERNRKSEALFRNLKVSVFPAGSGVWNCGTGAFFLVGGKPLFWNWKASPGLKAQLRHNTFFVEGKGTLTLRCQKKNFCRLTGSTPEHGVLSFSLGTSSPFSIDITSYNKKNNTVRVEKIKVSKNGTRNVRIPLSRFAHHHDLEQFEEITFTFDGRQSIRRCRISGLDLAGNAKNILPDPSFEESMKPEANYIAWGEYRSEELSRGLKFSTAERFHGKRSLEIAPGGFIHLQALDRTGHSAILSLYAKGEGEFEISLKQMLAKIHGSISIQNFSKTYQASKKWMRYECSFIKKQQPNINVLYIVKIRNSGKKTLYIDAVQLEQEGSLATKFNPQKRTNPPTMIGGKLPVDLPPEPEKLPENPESGRVKITAVNPDQRDYAVMPVHGGVTFAKGALFDPRGLRVIDSGGKTVPAQFSVIARRVSTDNSIISAGVTFSAALKAAERKDFYLEYGKKEHPAAGKNIAKQQGKLVHIDTGKLKITLTPYADSFLKDSDAYCGIQGIDGKIYRSKPEIVRIEENGPQKAVIFMRGKNILAWELRLTFFKDQPYMSADFAFENNYTSKDAYTRAVRSIFVELPGGKDYKADKFTGRGDALFVQRHTRSGYHKWDVYTVRNGRKEIIDDLKLSGVGSAGKAVFRIRNFAELAPRAIGFSENKIRLYPYPPEGTAYFDMPAGFSSSMQFNYAFDAKAVPDSASAVIHTDPAHTAKCGIFDHPLSQEDMQKYFPRTKRYLDSIFDAWGKNTRIRSFYGITDFGDFGSRNYYSNHETALCRHLWTRFLATGCVQDYKNAVNHTLHQRDIDQAHIGYGTAGVHTHHGFWNQSYSFHTGHFWLTGVVWHYLLTGDRRSYESAVSAMAALISKSGLRYPKGRERQRMLFHLAEVYGFTGLPQLKKAFERQFYNGGVSNGGGYYGALSHETLEKLYEVTGNKYYLECLTKEVKEFYIRNRINFKPMPEDLSKPPTVGGTSDSGRGIMSVFYGGRTAVRFNRPELINYLNAGKDKALITRMLDPRANDIHTAWIYAVLSAMKHFGMPEDPDTPDAYHFINQLTGSQFDYNNYEPFVFEIIPDNSGSCILDLYRYRKFRYWQQKTISDFVHCKIYSSTGKLLSSAVLNNNVTNERRRITVKSPDGKPVKAEVSFVDDAWGGISSPCRIRLSAKRRFGARNGGTVLIYLKAPKSGRINMNWCWRYRRNTLAGEILSAALESCGGEVIDQKAYTIPDEKRKSQFVYQMMTLNVPEKFRGKMIKLYIAAPKWISWDIQGLDHPWLGNTPKDL